MSQAVYDILQFLTTFGLFLGFKLNISKSGCFHINEAAKETGFHYLGDSLTSLLKKIILQSWL